ncbi:hypothetical protein V6615_04005 [Oscillospiraceae bacterium PP1C4]
MINGLFGHNALPYRKKVHLRIIYSTVITIAGGIAFTLATLAQSNAALHLDDYVRGFYTGGGAGAFIVGMLMIIRFMRILRDPERMRREDIKEKDERNIYIGQKIWLYSGYIFYIVLYVAMLVAGFYSKTVLITLTATLGTFAGIMLIVKTILNKTV